MRCKLLFFAFVTSAVLIFLPGGVVAQDKPIVLKLATADRLPHMVVEQLHYFVKRTDELTSGKVKIQVIEGGVLGTRPEMFDMIRRGDVELFDGYPEHLAAVVPKFSITTLPYMFKDFKHGVEAVHSPIGKQLSDELLQKTGVRIIGWMPLGYRQLLSKKPIKSFTDLKGVKVRVPEAKNYVEMVKGWGAEPVIIPWAEVYTALQTGMIEAVEAPYSPMESQKLHEIAKYTSVSNHIWQAATLDVNEKKWQSFPDDVRNKMLQAIKETEEWQVKRYDAQDKIARDRFIQAGKLTLYEPDLRPFWAAMAKVQEKFAEEYGYQDWIKQIRAMRP